MDFSNASDCIPHDLLIIKVYAYGFGIDSLQIYLFVFKELKTKCEINNAYSFFQVLLSGVPQGSNLGFIVFEIWIENAELHNFVGDNTVSWIAKSL